MCNNEAHIIDHFTIFLESWFGTKKENFQNCLKLGISVIETQFTKLDSRSKSMGKFGNT